MEVRNSSIFTRSRYQHDNIEPFGHIKCANGNYLQLNYCLNHELNIKLCGKFVNLKFLSLHCVQMTDEMFRTLAKFSGISLVKLEINNEKLQFVGQWSAVGLCHLLAKCPYLQSLLLLDVNHLTKNDYLDLFNLNMSDVDLSICHCFTRVTIYDIVCDCKSLYVEYLDDNLNYMQWNPFHCVAFSKTYDHWF